MLRRPWVEASASTIDSQVPNMEAYPGCCAALSARLRVSKCIDALASKTSTMASLLGRPRQSERGLHLVIVYWQWPQIPAHLKCTKCGAFGYVDTWNNWSEVIYFNKEVCSQWQTHFSFTRSSNRVVWTVSPTFLESRRRFLNPAGAFSRLGS